MTTPFQYLNDYYDKIFVLSLERLTDRRDHIKKSLNGLNYDFFEGVDKEQTSLPALKTQGLYSTERYRNFYKRPDEISLGMLCCSLGHVNIYKEIIRQSYKRTLILEDDAWPVEQTIPLFPSIVKELPSNWELFYLGYEKNEVFGNREKIKRTFYKLFTPYAQLKLSREIYSRYYPVPISTHISKAGFHDCSHAYAVTLEAAKKLLAKQQPVGFHPDNLLSYLATTGQLHTYISRPKLFNQLSAFGNTLDSLTSS